MNQIDMNHAAAVVVPIYKAEINADEEKALASICDKLGGRDIFAVIPEGLDIGGILGKYPNLKVKEYDPQFFKGIKGYNRLMTSPDFYASFSDYEYMLVAQLDAYIFRDDLDRWMEKGYDYVGAPWLKKKINCFPPMSWIKKIEDLNRRRKGLYSKIGLYGKVGNGGLSLRKIESLRRVSEQKAEELSALNSIGPKGQPEDVFWARQDSFKYPAAMEALDFAFDKYPALCYKLNGHRLPMGCHGWTSRKMLPFWRKMLPA
ncbi:MAG: hypothetical protein NC548_53550 [Lachnospiraceae bacterium]|nr:hypothetical protein [Lachnospiraceae bacterium]